MVNVACVETFHKDTTERRGICAIKSERGIFSAEREEEWEFWEWLGGSTPQAARCCSHPAPLLWEHLATQGLRLRLMGKCSNSRMIEFSRWGGKIRLFCHKIRHFFHN